MNGAALQNIDIVITEIEFSHKHGRILDPVPLCTIIRRRIALIGHRHQSQALPLCILTQLPCLGKVAGDGFFHHHMNASGEARHGVPIMQVVGRKH